ncbi:MAG: RNA-guided pseudouridylation complex pseudouridine synthase subunit Cbf5 [Thermoplasmatales archaeon]|jgi:H/ACA ribonucleoprotein complex subunit 4|nr:MAG: RNA-guided pseudouridylation complex pseudouridine synthase subunit Cbf5 [Thermoplasmatales archaeon]
MVEKKHFLPSDYKRKRLVKIQSKTNPNFGKKPEERSVKELLNKGFINLNKPNGPTSHQVDSWLKNILGNEKIGHSGTLDPKATGVLPIGIGEATKALEFLLVAGKEYIGLMTLHKKVDKKKITEVCKSLIGEIIQVPPLRSAVKRVKRIRQIYYFDIIEIKDRDVLFRVGCESGTYIRTLCVDIGKKLKSGAHLAELHRTRVGHIKEEDSVFLQDIKDAFVFYKEEKDEKSIRKIIYPVESMLSHLPKIVIRDSAVDALCHGASLAIPGVVELDSGVNKNDITLVLTLKNEGVAIVKTLMSTEEIIQKDKGLCANLERVIMKKGTYPSIWKKP